MKDTKETNTTNPTDELLNAVKVVQAAIKAKEDRYRRIASAEEQDPILIEGETRTGYDCHLMVDPKDVAQAEADKAKLIDAFIASGKSIEEAVSLLKPE